MDFYGKIQDRKGEAAALKGTLRGRERRMGLLMAGLVLVAAVVCGRNGGVREAASKQANHTDSRLVIIDAGHGGDDPGKIGVDGVQEKDLNLKMALALRDLLEQQDVEVLMTREDAGGLYDERTSNKKVQDMRRRCELINREKPACVISIHQNSYHEESIHGAQVFYYKTSKESGELAKILQKELARVVEPTNHRQAKANDTYYLLKKTEAPTVIVECGFLSNWDECAKLQNEEYQAKLVWAIQMGVLKYLNSNKFT
ncbi:MAG: N-acetylmuramoyl-L-alanine amidase [Eubacteriales bacterium]